eukprot:CAMPEP_0113678542 /NCGR_PEP_ID=MMETSP0038_2-20120614/10025_1 /TAXON_ID=2898 /ORGANISM="Cryptomonas paramecium" /LENGTH=78 /DNA_ID=CAMNT_0000596231 /DNA_START=109 /DNA_END=345 /DNA_ORIENTATION=+ /assembly_acc=CAM_ASM_000170
MATAAKQPEDPVKVSALGFLQRFRSELQKNYATQYTIPADEYKKAVEEVESEKVRLNLKSLNVQPRQKVSLKELSESL